MRFFDNPNDLNIIQRVYDLDRSVQKTREENYSEWSQFIDHEKTHLALADFVYANLKDALPMLVNNTLEIIWIACCSDHEMTEQILQYSNSFLKRRHPSKLAQLRVDLANFIQEVAETISVEMSEEDSIIQKNLFQNYLEHDPEIILPGELILQNFRKKVHVLYYLPDCNVAIPFFLQVQSNFSDLSTHSIMRHVCRNIAAVDKEPPDIYDWLHVLEYVRSRGVKPYSLTGNVHAMNSVNEWPGFLKLFSELFNDKSVTVEERFLQLITIYHPRWDQIFTLSGWRMNRKETTIILNFLSDYPKPFYQKRYIEELFHLIV